MSSSALTLLAISLLAVWYLRVVTRPAPAFDRIAFFDALLDGATPRLASSLPADPTKVAVTFQRIGSVALMSRMAACDAVTMRPFYTNRDFGDEDDSNG